MARDQRRLAAIVSADVAGYSRLMGEDESRTLAALKAHRRELIDPKIAEYGGRIVKTLATENRRLTRAAGSHTLSLARGEMPMSRRSFSC